MAELLTPENALAYVLDGWPVIPCDQGSERPMSGYSSAKAITNPEYIRRNGWFFWPGCAPPSHNLAGVLGRGVVAFDVDPGEGAEQTIADLAREGFELPPTRTHGTPRGGRHLLYTAPEGTRGGKLGPGLMLRGWGPNGGSYVMLPPSVIDGRSYTVADNRPWSELPLWVPEYLASHSPRELLLGEDSAAVACLQLQPTSYIPTAVDRFVDQPPRDHDITGQVLWFVCNCLQWGMTAGETLWLVTGCIARRRSATAQRRPRGPAHLGQAGTPPSAPRGAVRSGRLPERPGLAARGWPMTTLGLWAAALGRDDFWSARPVLAHIRDYARARRASPWATLGVVLVRTVMVTPPSVVLPPLVGSHASLNLFAGLVAPSGGGKGAAVGVAREAVDVGEVGDVEEAGIGSGEGLAHLFARRVKPKGQPAYVERTAEAMLLYAAEIDTLAALYTRQGSTLFGELRKAWMGEALGFSYADQDKRLPVAEHSYRLGLLVGIQPERAGVLLGDADAGTPQRVLWFPANDPEAPELPPPTPDSWPLPGYSKPAEVVSGRAVISVCTAARQVVDANRLARLRGNGHELDAHALLARLKVGAALALLNGRAEVAEEDWQLADSVMAVSDQTRSGVVEALQVATAAHNRARGLAEGHRELAKVEQLDAAGVERTASTIMRRLSRKGAEWVLRSDLRRFVPERDRGYFDLAIEHLGEQVEQDTDGPGTRYRKR